MMTSDAKRGGGQGDWTGFVVTSVPQRTQRPVAVQEWRVLGDPTVRRLLLGAGEGRKWSLEIEAPPAGRRRSEG